METVTDILKFTIPGLIVFATAYYIIKSFMDNEQKKREAEQKANTRTITIPVKMQAYERLVLFLERINPESLLVRIQTTGTTAGQLHQDLLTAVRAEYEHNLSQQIYLSQKTWLAVKQSKEAIVKIINQEASKLAANAPATALSEAILKNIIAQKDNPIQLAIDILKLEAGSFI